ncbi:DNA polymerase processivity subunit [Harp seal herpesvirus]|uniref:DNA polymerase processivity subunit n=1 Tax=phocid gammaherpesvirus 3 TaxID=2560643 RepID=A0A0R5YUA7_9GAMA|nr:DNA polymerase processivity subunit [Harp seal herpesvirus]AJG42986.1 DNA polymerase processivity subunit [Harp seal herpesvirus]
METITTHVAHFNVESLKKAAKIYNHIKIPAKKGLLQITGSEDQQELQVLANVGSGGVLVFKVFNPFDSFSVLDGPKEDFSISFQNQPYGNSYIHGKELFSVLVYQACMTFYRRQENTQPEFVKSKFVLTDENTKFYHHTALTSWPVPMQSLKMAKTFSKVSLSIKTATMLHKWLREKKGKGQQPVKIAVNQTLSVVVFSVNESSKTIDFQPVEEAQKASLSVAEKQGDFGFILKDSVYYVNLDSLIQSLSLCKLTATCSPCFYFHPEDVVEVVGLPLKGARDYNCTLSVLLIKASDSSFRPATPSPSIKDTDSCPEDSEEETDDAVSFIEKSLSSTSPPTFESTPQSFQAHKVSKKPSSKTQGESHKRKPDSKPGSALKPKQPKLTFNPLI